MCDCGLPAGQRTSCLNERNTQMRLMTAAVTNLTRPYANQIAMQALSFGRNGAERISDVYSNVVTGYRQVLLPVLNERNNFYRLQRGATARRIRDDDVDMRDVYDQFTNRTFSQEQRDLDAAFASMGSTLNEFDQMFNLSTSSTSSGLTSAARAFGATAAALPEQQFFTTQGLRDLGTTVFGSVGAVGAGILGVAAATGILFIAGFISSLAGSLFAAGLSIGPGLAAGTFAVSGVLFAPIAAILAIVLFVGGSSNYRDPTREEGYISASAYDTFRRAMNATFADTAARANAIASTTRTVTNDIRSRYVAAVNRIVPNDFASQETTIRRPFLAEIQRINDRYCGACTIEETFDCSNQSRATGPNRQTCTPTYNAATQNCDCDCVPLDCTQAEIDACPGARTSPRTHDLDPTTCRCVARSVTPTCSDTAIRNCSVRNTDGNRATLGAAPECRCTVVREDCSAAQIRAVVAATPSGQVYVGHSWNAATQTCDGEYEAEEEEGPGTDGPATECTQTERENCVNQTTPSVLRTPVFRDGSCECDQFKRAIDVNDILNCRSTTTCADNQYVWPVLSTSGIVSCECRMRAEPPMTANPCDAVQAACSTAQSLNTNRNIRYVYRAGSGQATGATPCRCVTETISDPCSAMPACARGQERDPQQNCACIQKDCTEAISGQCESWQSRGFNAANECACIDRPCPQQGFNRNAEGVCVDAEGNEPACAGCSNAAQDFISAGLRAGTLRTQSGIPLHVLNYCGGGVSNGYRWDLDGCCCLPICTDPRSPIWDPDDGQFGGCVAAPEGVTVTPCPSGQLRNEDGDCITPPPIEVPGIDPTPLPVAPPPAPPPTVIPPCGKFRSTTDWRCVRSVSPAARVVQGFSGCTTERPLTRVTPKPLLLELACETLANPSVSDGAKLSAQVYLQRNGG